MHPIHQARQRPSPAPPVQQTLSTSILTSAFIDSHIAVIYHDCDIGVGGGMAYTGKVTSAESLGRILQQARLLSGLSQRDSPSGWAPHRSTSGNWKQASRQY